MKSIDVDVLSGGHGGGTGRDPEVGSESDRGTERGQCGGGRDDDDAGDNAVLVGLLLQFIHGVCPLLEVKFPKFPSFRGRNFLCYFANETTPDRPVGCDLP